MTKSVTIKLWDRVFNLPVEYDPGEDSKAEEKMSAALNAFCLHDEWLAKAKSSVEAYCKAKVAEDETNQKKENIFSYISPEYIFVKHRNKHNIIALVCRYRYDEEHGIMIVFDENGNARIGGQDMPF